MNYRNMTFEELVREAAHSDDLLTLELVKRIDELETELSEARDECERLEKEIDIRPLCEDEDHADYADLREFFDDCHEMLYGETDNYNSVADNAKAMLEELHELLGGRIVHIILELLAVLAALLTFTR